MGNISSMRKEKGTTSMYKGQTKNYPPSDIINSHNFEQYLNQENMINPGQYAFIKSISCPFLILNRCKHILKDLKEMSLM